MLGQELGARAGRPQSALGSSQNPSRPKAMGHSRLLLIRISAASMRLQPEPQLTAAHSGEVQFAARQERLDQSSVPECYIGRGCSRLAVEGTPGIEFDVGESHIAENGVSQFRMPVKRSNVEPVVEGCRRLELPALAFEFEGNKVALESLVSLDFPPVELEQVCVGAADREDFAPLEGSLDC